MKFKLYIRFRNNAEDEKFFASIGEVTASFFRHLSNSSQRVEIYENTNTAQDPQWRLAVHAVATQTPEAFRVIRIVNIF